jgi:UPF0716 family protein affecting phage T7 exclusion
MRFPETPRRRWPFSLLAVALALPLILIYIWVGYDVPFWLSLGLLAAAVVVPSFVAGLAQRYVDRKKPNSAT